MAESTTAEKAPASKSDIWIALGVVACLALGASVTFLMTGGHESGPRQRTAVIEGQDIKSHGATDNKASPAATSTAASTGTATSPSGESDYLPVTFDTLAGFYYEPPPVEDEGTEKSTTLKRPKDQIPAPVRALDGKKVAVQGFMVPFKLEKGATRTFLLVKDQSYCCFGRTPRMNEWISVTMAKDKTTKLITDQVVTAFGTLHVSEESVQGVVLSIYRFDCDDVAGPLDL
jgi:hypothetical protein